jgi:hypothetical protein
MGLNQEASYRDGRPRSRMAKLYDAYRRTLLPQARHQSLRFCATFESPRPSTTDFRCINIWVMDLIHLFGLPPSITIFIPPLFEL